MPDWPSAEAPPDWQANGVFQDRYSATERGHKLPENNRRFIDQHDGATSTLIVSERLAIGRWNDMAEHEVGFVWHPQGAPAEGSPGAPDFDVAKYQPARPSSGHPGVFNAAFCDGHARPIDADIDYRVYAQLMTPRGGKAAYPGLRSGACVEVDDTFRTQELPEEFR
jgi:prepilin-type processing-associated H-X9-DG protein